MNEDTTLIEPSLFQPQPQAQQNRDAELPSEIILTIISDFRPVYSFTSPLEYQAISTLHDLHQFAQLRLISRAWYNCITPLLYSTLFIPCSEKYGMSRRFGAVKYKPHLVETLILYGISGCTKDDQELVRRYLPACFAACTELKKLDLREPYNALDGIKATGIRKMFCHFADHPIISLRIECRNAWTLSIPMQNVLKGMIRGVEYLEELEIIVHRGVVHSEVYDLPKRFSSLERLHLKGFGIANIKKLLSRIYRKETVVELPPHGGSSSSSTTTTVITMVSPRPNSKITTPLRHLQLTKIVDPIPHLTIFPDLLSINNLGLSLTSLHLHHLSHAHPGHYSDSDADLIGIPQRILKICPLLQRFMYFVPSTQDWVYHLPPSIIAIGVYVSNPANYPPDTRVMVGFEGLIEVVKKAEGYRRCLRELVVRYSYSYADSAVAVDSGLADLKRACGVVGIRCEIGKDLG